MMLSVILCFNAITAFVISNNNIGMVLFDESYDDKGDGEFADGKFDEKFTDDKFNVYFTDEFDSSGDHQITAGIDENTSDVVTIEPVTLITREPNTSVTEGDAFDNFFVNAIQNIIGFISTLF